MKNLSSFEKKLIIKVMETILAILLYLQLIVSPGTYNDTYINELKELHRIEVENVQNDPAQMQIVNDVYLPQVVYITIIDTQSGD